MFILLLCNCFLLNRRILLQFRFLTYFLKLNVLTIPQLEIYVHTGYHSFLSDMMYFWPCTFKKKKHQISYYNFIKLNLIHTYKQSETNIQKNDFKFTKEAWKLLNFNQSWKQKISLETPFISSRSYFPPLWSAFLSAWWEWSCAR